MKETVALYGDSSETEQKVSLFLSSSNSTYCETHKTVNTRNIYGMLLFCER